jgi:hypothetical protein
LWVEQLQKEASDAEDDDSAIISLVEDSYVTPDTVGIATNTRRESSHVDIE